MSRENAKKALKQVRMEIAADYEMDHESAFEIIESASQRGSFAHHFRKLEQKRNAFSGNHTYLE